MNFFLFALVGLFWGCSFPAIKVVIESFPPVFAADLRVMLSCTVLTIIYLITKKPMTIPRSIRWKVWTAGLFFQGIPFSLLFWGEKTVPAGIAGTINGTVPLWTLLLSSLFFKGDELFSKRKISGLLLGFFGILLIYGPQVQLGGKSRELMGLVAITCMALCYGIGTVLNRRFLVKRINVNKYAMLYHQHLSSIVYLTIVSLVLEGKPSSTLLVGSWKALLATGYLAIFSTAFAWIIFFRLLELWGSVRTVAVTYIIPVVAILVDYLLFNNFPTLPELAGAMTIFLGTFLLQTKTQPLLKQPAMEAA